ncbi:hypothetical protein BJ684DRAFT_14656 [Piptocephalis cylindrospora]|uniref:Uncharacterized protein n=1 Tax=Piptocephalis cylindrospora TaxID=1907219 RepID=A0A4P9Y8E0_9FUNG|nr:hypothetical protein BJ684DRAFT_14656 [Piptocephalis cylindrospora]|eukprot:RKP15054.1 hypothetical protein BJ684DRAFT_14656 [Piptocephalis cylindrospora]
MRTSLFVLALTMVLVAAVSSAPMSDEDKEKYIMDHGGNGKLGCVCSYLFRMGTKQADIRTRKKERSERHLEPNSLGGLATHKGKITGSVTGTRLGPEAVLRVDGTNGKAQTHHVGDPSGNELLGRIDIGRGIPSVDALASGKVPGGSGGEAAPFDPIDVILLDISWISTPLGKDPMGGLSIPKGLIMIDGKAIRGTIIQALTQMSPKLHAVLNGKRLEDGRVTLGPLCLNSGESKGEKADESGCKGELHGEVWVEEAFELGRRGEGKRGKMAQRRWERGREERRGSKEAAVQRAMGKWAGGRGSGGSAKADESEEEGQREREGGRVK